MTDNKSDGEEEIVLTPVEARQGRLGRPVLIVLVVSTLLTIGALFAAGVITL
jgi:hypothetical protein